MIILAPSIQQMQPLQIAHFLAFTLEVTFGEHGGGHAKGCFAHLSHSRVPSGRNLFGPCILGVFGLLLVEGHLHRPTSTGGILLANQPISRVHKQPYVGTRRSEQGDICDASNSYIEREKVYIYYGLFQKTGPILGCSF